LASDIGAFELTPQVALSAGEKGKVSVAHSFFLFCDPGAAVAKQEKGEEIDLFHGPGAPLRSALGYCLAVLSGRSSTTPDSQSR
jgi:hypothetical protein